VFPTSQLLEKPVALWHLLREGDLSAVPRWAKLLIYPIRILLRTFDEFLNDKCILRASSLAYSSLLAMVPVTALFFFSVAKFNLVADFEAFENIKIKVGDLLFNNLAPAQTDIIKKYITEYTQNINLLGAFGFAMLFMIAIFLFNTIEHTINDIWHAKQRRPLLNRFLAFWAVLTLPPLLFLVSSVFAAKLKTRDIDVLSLRFLPHVLNWFAFWLAYKVIPYTKVRFRAAFFGAAAAGILWQLAKGGFSWYISNMASFDKLYGSLGAVPVFLIWLYVTWLIVLFGAEVAYAVQFPRERSHLTKEELAGYMDFYSVRAMAEITRRFGAVEDNKTSTIDVLRNVGIPPEVMGDILNRLSERQLIVYTEDKDYVPARQPSKIMVREVVEAVSGKKLMAPETADDAVSIRLRKTFKEITEGVDAAFGNLDLETLTNGVEN
jgi:membrane protein